MSTQPCVFEVLDMFLQQIFSSLETRFKNAEEVKDILSILMTRHFICESNTESFAGPGRKKSTVYKINPYMTEMTEMT